MQSNGDPMLNLTEQQHPPIQLYCRILTCAKILGAADMIVCLCVFLHKEVPEQTSVLPPPFNLNNDSFANHERDLMHACACKCTHRHARGEGNRSNLN